MTLDIVNQTAGVAARDYLAALAQDIVHQDAAHALEAIDGLHRESKDMSRLCEEMAEYFRGRDAHQGPMKDRLPAGAGAPPRSWR